MTPDEDDPFLKSTVCPVCRYREDNSHVHIERLYGTGFHLGDGVYMTAWSVINRAEMDLSPNEGRVGICPIQEVDERHTILGAPLLGYERAPEPYDAAVFRAKYWAKGPFRISPLHVEAGHTVTSTGYRISSTLSDEGFEIKVCIAKGRVERKIPSGRIRGTYHPDAFELSFMQTDDLWGAPLFVPQDGVDILIGICTGLHTLHAVDDDGFSVGLAHDIRPLLEWKPKLLAGLSLRELLDRNKGGSAP